MGLVQKYGSLLGKGFVIEFAPDIARGILLELFEARKVNTAKATAWVEANTSLWTTLGPDYQKKLKQLVQRLPNIDWITPDWVIETIKVDYPGVASLFLGWKKASNWLSRQLNEIKAEVSKES